MNKVSGGDRIPVELFQFLKDDVVKVLHSICQQIWKTQQWPQDWKRSVFIPIPKNAQTTTQLHSHTSKVMLKILQARLQEYMNRELPNVHADFRKGQETRDQIFLEKAKKPEIKFSMICWIIEKAETPEIKLPTSTGSSKK